MHATHPSYGPDPVIALDGRRRRRRAGDPPAPTPVDLLASLDEAAWSHPSRCEGWTNRDVVVHLDSTNAFWTHSITEGRRGRPTRFLTTFDPVVSPAELVAATEERSGAETVERFAASTDALLALVEQLDSADWTATAESPAGHVSVATVVHHALWDAWVHERDIALPLGRPAVEDDEVLAALASSQASARLRIGRHRPNGPDRHRHHVTGVGDDRRDRRSGRGAAGATGLAPMTPMFSGSATPSTEALNARSPWTLLKRPNTPGWCRDFTRRSIRRPSADPRA